LPGVEGLLDKGDEVLLARGLLVVRLDPVLADRELEREPAAGHLVEGLREQPCILRLLGQLPVERGVGRELERQPVLSERGRMRLAEHRGGRDRAALDGGEDGALPRLLELRQLERRRLRARRRLRGGLLLWNVRYRDCPCVMA